MNLSGLMAPRAQPMENYLYKDHPKPKADPTPPGYRKAFVQKLQSPYSESSRLICVTILNSEVKKHTLPDGDVKA